MKINNMEKMTIREVRKLFIQFLKENNALEKYKKNIIIQGGSHFNTLCDYVTIFTSRKLNYCFDNGDLLIHELINYAFIWVDTDEGDSYWLKLDKSWRKIVTKKNIKIINEKI